MGRPRLPFLVLLILTACGHGNDLGPPGVDLSGHWLFRHDTSGGGAFCSETGSIDFRQVDSTLSGVFAARGGCEGTTSAFDYTKTGGAVGQIATDILTFTLRASFETCTYQGRVDAGVTNAFGGSVVCAAPGGATARQGSWSMER
jgi:hypothetical protein